MVIVVDVVELFFQPVNFGFKFWHCSSCVVAGQCYDISFEGVEEGLGVACVGA